VKAYYPDHKSVVKSCNLNTHLKRKHPDVFEQFSSSTSSNIAAIGAAARAGAEKIVNAPKEADSDQDLERQVTLMRNYFKVGKGKTDSRNHIRANVLQVLFAAATRSSFRTSSSTWLSHLVNAAGGSGSLLVGHQYLSGPSLDFVYGFCIRRMERQLRSASSFSISFDLWSSRSARKALLAISY